MKKTVFLTSLILLLATVSCFAESKTIDCEESSAVYLIFDEEPGEYTVNGKQVENSYFLHQYVEIDPATKITIDGAVPKKVYTFDKNNVPDWVQKWEAPCEKADLLLISSHADDEQLFFAGILPYYTQVKDMEVQVAYATDHLGQLSRHHERLNGLWAVGVRHYPVSSGYDDMYSESYEQALNCLIPYGIDENAVVEWEKSLITRFEPQVIVTHDVNGEYGHGMHMLVNGTLQLALKDAESEFSFLKKVYFHLYDENQIELSWMDKNFSELGGLSPFQVTQQKGFPEHESQQWTWFNRWINGANKEITKASQIKTYNPAEYGCFYSSVGADSKRDDFFENVLSYEEQRLEAERIAAEEAEAKRLAEEEAKRLELEAQAHKKKLVIIGVTCVVTFLVCLILVLVLGKTKKSSKHSKH